MPQKFQLKNGMKVLLVESRKSPVVAVQMWVKTGSADEKKGLEGISHFIEHLVFKGSKKFGVGEMAGTIEGAGGVLNAYTTFDQTVFYVTLSSEFADSGLEVISEMMGSPQFDAGEIDNEREVVIEEIKRSLDNPHQQASRLLFSSMYKKHPYGIPVIGYDENIRRVSRDEIVKYYRTRYVPQNMELVVVGNFSPAEMKKKVEKHFGTFRGNKPKPIVRKSEPARKAPNIVVKGSTFSESYLYFSWPVPNAKHKDNAVLSVLALILGQGESSRLVRTLRNEKNLVNNIGASVFTPKDPGFFAVSASLNAENIKSVLAGVENEIMLLAEHGPAEDELAKAIRQFESERFYSMETVDGLAGLYGHFEFLYNDYRQFDKFLKQVSKISARDVRTAAKKYLARNKMTVTTLAPSAEKYDVEHIEKDVNVWAAEFGKLSAKTIEKKPKEGRPKKRVPLKIKTDAAQKAADPVLFKLPNGARLAIKPVPGAPVLGLRFGFMGGLRYEQTPGANELTGRVWSAGTKDLSEVELNQKIEDMAASVSSFCGRNSMGVSGTALVPFADGVFDLMQEIVLNPRLAAEVIEREKHLMKEHVKMRNDKPAQVCMLNLTKNMFKHHPYGRDPYGTPAEISALTEAQIKEHLQRVVCAENLVVTLVGDIKIDAWKKKIEKFAARLPQAKFKKADVPLAELDGNTAEFIQLEKEQSHIVLAYRGITLTAPERFTLEVLQSVLSGQGGRLFVELRDKASLAYTVSPMRMDGIEGGYFGAYIGCSPDKGTKAVQMMLDEFHKLQATLVPEEELERAKRYIIGRHDIALQRTGHISDQLLFDELYGVPFGEIENFSKRIHAVTPEAIKVLAKKIFSSHKVLSVVGKTNVSL